MNPGDTDVRDDNLYEILSCSSISSSSECDDTSESDDYDDMSIELN